MFGILTMKHLANGLEYHSKLLQSSSLTAEMARMCLKQLTRYFNEQREIGSFDQLIKETEQSTGLAFKNELRAKRARKTPAALADFNLETSTFSDSYGVDT